MDAYGSKLVEARARLAPALGDGRDFDGRTGNAPRARPRARGWTVLHALDGHEKVSPPHPGMDGRRRVGARRLHRPAPALGDGRADDVTRPSGQMPHPRDRGWPPWQKKSSASGGACPRSRGSDSQQSFAQARSRDSELLPIPPKRSLNAPRHRRRFLPQRAHMTLGRLGGLIASPRGDRLRPTGYSGMPCHQYAAGRVVDGAQRVPAANALEVRLRWSAPTAW